MWMGLYGLYSGLAFVGYRSLNGLNLRFDRSIHGDYYGGSCW